MDQMGRPAINTVFNNASSHKYDRELFNRIVPAEQRHLGYRGRVARVLRLLGGYSAANWRRSPGIVPDVFFTDDEIREFGEELQPDYRADLYKRKYLPNVRPFPAVPDLLSRLKRDGRRVVLASSAKQEELDQILDLLGARDLIEGVITADDVDRSKPCPDVFEAALDRLGSVAPREVVVVGDTPYDAQAAARIGLATIGVLGGRSPRRSSSRRAASRCTATRGPPRPVRRVAPRAEGARPGVVASTPASRVRARVRFRVRARARARARARVLARFL